jgi:dTDP-4-amino-4,6-dideoxygalactose transaminase
VLEEGARRGITLRTYYDPLHHMPAFAACKRADALAVTDELAARMLSLPMAADLDEGEIAAIAEVVQVAAYAKL